MILKDKNSHIPWRILNPKLNALIVAAKNLESDKIQKLLQQILPNYTTMSYSTAIKEDINLVNPIIKAEA